MSFTSLVYIPFLCIVAIIYYALDIRLKPYFLLSVSWFVYALFGLWHFCLLLFVTVVSFGFGFLCKREQNRDRLYLGIGVIIVTGILFYVKYFDMFLLGLSGMTGLLGNSLEFSERAIILPVGISFYVFQAISYMIDVYRGEPRERNFIKYALYISFFPQLVAGPIEQARDLIPQLKGSRVTMKDISIGCRYLLSGYIRKVAIADYMAIYVDRIYENVMQQSGCSLVVATVFFAIQIYCDFSGYTHIAIGSARFLGIHLTENFDRPYLAEGCRDFWKRWHITLTRWFTQYLYIPLGGNRKSRCRKYFNIMIVFLLSGLWHGADVKFLIWGGFFGLWRIMEEIRKVQYGVMQRGKEGKVQIWIKRTGTFVLVCIAWIFFRSQSVSEALEILYRIFTMKTGKMAIVTGEELLGTAVRIGLLAVLPRIIEVREKESINLYYITMVLVFMISICILASFDNGGGSGFIYFQF